jgi:PKD repeat protein
VTNKLYIPSELRASELHEFLGPAFKTFLSVRSGVFYLVCQRPLMGDRIMRLNFNRFACLLLAASLLFVLGAPSEALSLRETHWKQLQAAADLVVSGTVASLCSEPTLEPNAGGVQTRMILRDTETLFHREGLAAPAPFSVILPGGLREDGSRLMLPGAPKFTPGEKVVLFVRQSNQEFALVGHGLGVLRRSTDGAWVAPDVAAVDGPPASGETYSGFAARLGATVAEPDTTSTLAARGGWTPFFAMLIVALVLFLIAHQRRNAAKAALLLLGSGGLVFLATGTSRGAAASGAASRGFALAGPKWDLSQAVRGRVEAGKILWLKGRGTSDLPDATALNTFQQMFQKWEYLSDSTVAFRQDGETIEAGQAIDQRNVLSFLEKVPTKIFDEFTLAVTFLIYNESDGLFIDTDIVFNDRDVVWAVDSSAISLDRVALHEIGHFIGLDHTNDSADVMYPTAKGVSSFSVGDIEGARTLYPLDSTLAPVAAASASPAIGNAPLAVSFSSENSFGRAGLPVTYSWDFGDGSPLDTSVAPAHTYAAAGTYTALLTVADANGNSTNSVTIIAGSGGSALTTKKFSAQVSFATPLRGGGSRDKFSIVLAGADLAAGDQITFKIGDITIGSGINAITLDSRASSKGNSDIGGSVSARYNAKSRELSLTLTGAALGLDFDPRSANDTAQTGSGSFPVTLLIAKADGSKTVLTGQAGFVYAVKSGNTPNGHIEKSVTLKF